MAPQPDDSDQPSGIRHSRRAFLASAGAGLATLAGGAAANAGHTGSDRAPSAAGGPASLGLRRGRAHNVRVTAASAQLSRPVVDHPVNGDEDRYPTRLASYSKGLPHDELGHVDPAAYAALLRAVESGDPADFDRIPRGSPALAARLKNPQAGIAFVLQGADPEQLTMRPAPAFASDEAAGEMVELYWMALARDVPFAEYTSSALVAEAADDLSGMSDFRGPKFDGEVTGATLFRADVPGALSGRSYPSFCGSMPRSAPSASTGASARRWPVGTT